MNGITEEVSMEDLTQEFITEVAAAQEAFSTKGKSLLKVVVQRFFADFPEVKALQWEQYTPYFMDGDTCEFGVNDVAFVSTDDEEILAEVSYGEYDGEDDDVIVYSQYGDEANGALKAAIKTFNTFLHSDEMEDVLKTMFGDHVRVTVTAKGFKVEEYDHE